MESGVSSPPGNKLQLRLGEISFDSNVSNASTIPLCQEIPDPLDSLSSNWKTNVLRLAQTLVKPYIFNASFNRTGFESAVHRILLNSTLYYSPSDVRETLDLILQNFLGSSSTTFIPACELVSESDAILDVTKEVDSPHHASFSPCIVNESASWASNSISDSSQILKSTNNLAIIYDLDVEKSRPRLTSVSPKDIKIFCANIEPIKMMTVRERWLI